MAETQKDGPEVTDIRNPDGDIEFHMHRSKQHRTVHVDGVFGGVTPTGSVVMNMFSEQFPIPDFTVHEVKDDGTLGVERRKLRGVKSGIEREIEVSLMMTIERARSVYAWLGGKLDQIEEQQKLLGGK